MRRVRGVLRLTAFTPRSSLYFEMQHLQLRSKGIKMQKPVGPHDPGFMYRVRKSREVEVFHLGRLASTLRGADAEDFKQEAEAASGAEAQQLMARVTGNYKHGNERKASEHHRNRGLMSPSSCVAVACSSSRTLGSTGERPPALIWSRQAFLGVLKKICVNGFASTGSSLGTSAAMCGVFM